MTDNLLPWLSSHAHPTGRVVGLPADKAKIQPKFINKFITQEEIRRN